GGAGPGGRPAAQWAVQDDLRVPVVGGRQPGAAARARVVGPPGGQGHTAAPAAITGSSGSDSGAGAAVQAPALPLMSSSDTQAARTRTGSGSASRRTNATPAPVAGSEEIRSEVAPLSLAPSPSTMSTCSGSSSRIAIRSGNRFRIDMTSFL